MPEQLTNLEPSADMLKSQYGYVTYAKWCELECKRLGVGFYTKHDGDKCAIYTVRKLKEVKPE